MTRVKEDKVREDRIMMEVVVDAYDEEERAMGWYYYVSEEAEYPFEAECIEERRVSPLKKGEKVKVLETAPAEDCEREIFVEIEWSGRTMGVPLSQLKPVNADSKTQEVVEDWHYWTAQGYEF